MIKLQNKSELYPLIYKNPIIRILSLVTSRFIIRILSLVTSRFIIRILSLVTSRFVIYNNPDDNWKDMEHVYQNVFDFFCCVDLTGSISYQVHIIKLVYTVSLVTSRFIIRILSLVTSRFIIRIQSLVTSRFIINKIKKSFFTENCQYFETVYMQHTSILPVIT
jgi:hypothetical protein